MTTKYETTAGATASNHSVVDPGKYALGRAWCAGSHGQIQRLAAYIRFQSTYHQLQIDKSIGCLIHIQGKLRPCIQMGRFDNHYAAGKAHLHGVLVIDMNVDATIYLRVLPDIIKQARDLHRHILTRHFDKTINHACGRIKVYLGITVHTPESWHTTMRADGSLPDIAAECTDPLPVACGLSTHHNIA